MSIEGVANQVHEHVQRFTQTRDLTELRLGANLVGTIEMHTVADYAERQRVREARLLLWLELLNTLDSVTDPAFDPADVPAARVDVPDTPMKPGWMMSSPEGIADPEVRRQYDEAVRANAEKATHYRFQKELRQMDAELTPQADAYIRSAYLRSPVSVKEMDAAIAARIQSPERARHLRSLVTPSAPR